MSSLLFGISAFEFIGIYAVRICPSLAPQVKPTIGIPFIRFICRVKITV